MQGQNIQVFVRSRPLGSREKLIIETTSREVKISDRNNAKSFHFDHVFNSESRQSEIYRIVVQPLIEQVLDGFNCTVFAYGQTGTGKTFTMEGERSCENINWEEDPQLGIIPRSISELFDQLLDHDNNTVRVSFLELYNEDTYDLLSPIDDTTKLKIFEDAQKKGSVIVGGLTEVIVKTKNQIYEILKKGSAKRQTAATLMNACSSRSHTIFSITIHIREGSIEGEELLKIGKLNLVDLAGSENIGRSGAQDKRAREAGNINQSLLTLGRVITALVEKRPHIPYRESKLTRLLQDSLGGKTKTSIIATISPASIDLEDTLSTLDYAMRAKKITNKPEMNQRLTTRALLKEYAQEIERLRKDLVATREKNGIHLDKDHYEEMCKQLSATNSIVREKEDYLKAVQFEQNKNKELHDELAAQAEKFRLKLTKVAKANQIREVEFGKTLENATMDNNLLHEKKERLENLSKENRSSLVKFQTEFMNEIDSMEFADRTFNDDFNRRVDAIFEELEQYKKSEAINRECQVLSNQVENLDINVHDLRRQIELLENQIEIKTNLKKELIDKLNNLKEEGLLLKQNGDVCQVGKENLMNLTNTYRTRVKTNHDLLCRKVNSFISYEIKDDVKTGSTPQKTTYTIPKVNVCWTPNDKVLEIINEPQEESFIEET